MSSQIEEYAQAYSSSLDLAKELVRDMSHEQLNWKPDQKTWSVAECIQHLNLVGRKYVPALGKAASTSAPRSDGPFSYGWISRKFIKSVSPSTKRKLKTLKDMNPYRKGTEISDLDKKAIMSEYEQITNGYIDALRKAKGLDFAKIKVSSPFFSAFKLPMGAFFDAMGQHQIRHVEQAQRVAEMASFPA